jgi:hypothetical protein
MALTGGIPLGSQFRFTAGLSLDMREVVANITARNALESGIRFEGLTVYVISEQKFYALKGGILDANWFELPSTPGIVVVADETERLAIDAGDRYEGMIVYQIDEQVNYQLVGGILDANWARLRTSGGSSGTKNYYADPTFKETIDDNVTVFRKLSASASGFFVGTTSELAAFPGFGAIIPDGTPVKLFSYAGSSYPSDIDPNRIYYIKVLPGDDIALAETIGGPVFTITTPGSTGTYVLHLYMSVSLAKNIETTAPLVEGGSLSLTYTPPGTGEIPGAEFLPSVIDREDRGKPLYFRVPIDASASNYRADDFNLRFYDLTSGKELYTSGDKDIDKNSQEYVIKVFPLETTEQILPTINLEDDGNTGTYTIQFGSFRLNTDVLVPGVIGGFIGTETWTDSLATTTTSVELWRDKSFVYIKGRTNYTGAGGSVSITIPSTYAPKDTTPRYVNDSVNTLMDVGNNSFEGSTYLSNSTTLLMAVQPSSGYPALTLLSSTIPFTWVSGDYIEWTAYYQVNGWGDGAVFSTTEMLNKGTRFRASRNGTNQTGIAPNNSAIKLLFNSNASSLDYGGLYYDATNSRFIVTQRDVYSLKASAFINSTNVLASRYSMLIYINGSEGISGQSVVGTVGASMPLTVSAPDILLQAGDVIEVYLYGAGNNSSSTLTMDGSARLSSFSAQQLFDSTSFSVYGEFKLLTATSSVKTPGASLHYLNMTGNSVNLPPGTYKLTSGHVSFGNNASSPSYTFIEAGWWGSNGADTTTRPTPLVNVAGLKILSAHETSPTNVALDPSNFMAVSGTDFKIEAPTIIVSCAQACTVYLVPRAGTGAATNARITTYITAEKLQ